MVLASFLLVGSLGIVGLMSQTADTLQANAPIQPWQVAFERQLRWDFANARQFELEQGKLTLLGFASRNGATHAPLHRPASVVYENVTAADHVWLVRREERLDSISNRNVVADLVCAGPVSLSMRLLGDEDPVVEAAGSLPTTLTLSFGVSGDSHSHKVRLTP